MPLQGEYCIPFPSLLLLCNYYTLNIFYSSDMQDIYPEYWSKLFFYIHCFHLYLIFDDLCIIRV